MELRCVGLFSFDLTVSPQLAIVVFFVFFLSSPAVQHLLHPGRRGEGGRLRTGDGHGPGGGGGGAQRPDAGAAADPPHGSGGHQAVHEPRAGAQTD